jgi:hypothetical protein
VYSHYETTKTVTGLGTERAARKALADAESFMEVHRVELELFDSAERYLQGVLQKRFDPKTPPPIDKWTEELKAKSTEKDALYREYFRLKNETSHIEKVKRGIMEIADMGIPKRSKQKIMDVRV